jgi:hypothetical protein
VRTAAAAALCLVLGGCAQILGLEDPQQPSACTGSSTCDLRDPTTCSASTCRWNVECGEASCTDQSGGTALGGACTNGDQCVAGADCVLNVCRRYCQNDSDCASIGGGSVCKADFTPNWPVLTCSDPCLPVTETNCAANDTCIIIQGANTGSCIPGGARPAGADCSDNAFDCGSGEVCYVSGAAHTCRTQCDPAGAACTTGTCTPESDLFVNNTQYGVCL